MRERNSVANTIEIAHNKLSALYETALETAGDAIFIIDADEKVIYANAHAEKLFGFSRKELLHQVLPELLVPKEALEMHLNLVSTAREGRKTERYRTCRLTKQGCSIDVEVTMSPLFSNGESSGFVKILRDIRETVTLEKDLLDKNLKLKYSFHAMVELAGKLQEMRDGYTNRHQIRVSELCGSIGRQMGLSKERLEMLSIAAKLHDIGKIAIPLDLLIKPGRLTAEEFALVKTHAAIGAGLLRHETFSVQISCIIGQHHEKMDGSGYPAGLKGEDILLEARIICVADVVEAMSSHRPYRPTLGIDAALEEITQNRGKLYDSDVVDICLNLHSAKS